MVLNFTGFSSLKYQFHISEAILLILSMLLGIFSCLRLNEVTNLCAGQCMLFAKLYERARILQGSSPGWCYLPACLHLAAALCSLVVLSFVRGGRYRWVCCSNLPFGNDSDPCACAKISGIAMGQTKEIFGKR